LGQQGKPESLITALKNESRVKEGATVARGSLQVHEVLTLSQTITNSIPFMMAKFRIGIIMCTRMISSQSHYPILHHTFIMTYAKEAPARTSKKPFFYIFQSYPRLLNILKRKYAQTLSGVLGVLCYVKDVDTS
jgi:hypothetical protein